MSIFKAARLLGIHKPNAAAPPQTLVIRRSNSTSLKQTCLHDFHQGQKAKMEPFAGYLMPIVYKGQTIKSEHMQTRTSASVFDVSHMMQTIVRGKDRTKFLESITVTDIEDLGLNKCALSVFTNASGGIIDDCIIGKCEQHIQIVSNAGNADLVWAWMNKARREASGLDVELERLDGHGLVALQGPRAAAALQKLTSFKLNELKFMNTTETNLRGIGQCTVTRCGYTGEDGFEISVKASDSVALMELLCSTEGGDLVKPAGLGARDTLRLEAGLCLHGRDITDKTTPIEAALNWVIHRRRRQEGGFPGAQKILEQLQSGSPVKRVGLLASMTGGPPAREGCDVVLQESKVGQVTSGNFAPVLGRNIAMAYLPTGLLAKEDDKILHCLVRGKPIEYKLTKMPFVKTNYFM